MTGHFRVIFSGPFLVDFATIFLVTTLTALILVAMFQSGRQHAGLARALVSVQAVHDRPTPRIGGVAILCGYLVMMLVALPPASTALAVGTSLVPIFVIGLLEDLQVPMSPLRRLVAVWAGSLAQVWLCGFWLFRFDLPFLDPLAAHATFGIPLTLLLVGGISHAFNLIDGLHGLSAGVAILTSVALGFLATGAGDAALAQFAYLFAAVLGGFLVVNYPFGRLFLGDAGAYSVGYVLAWLGIVLLVRNPSLSAWSVFLVFFWPIAETFWAIVRRKLNGHPATHADRMHMHHVVLRGLEMVVIGRGRRRLANPVATLLLLPFAALPMLAGIAVRQDARAGAAAAAAGLAIYITLHILGVRFVRQHRLRRGAAGRLG